MRCGIDSRESGRECSGRWMGIALLFEVASAASVSPERPTSRRLHRRRRDPRDRQSGRRHRPRDRDRDDAHHLPRLQMMC